MRVRSSIRACGSLLAGQRTSTLCIGLSWLHGSYAIHHLALYLSSARFLRRQSPNYTGRSLKSYALCNRRLNEQRCRRGKVVNRT